MVKIPRPWLIVDSLWPACSLVLVYPCNPPGVLLAAAGMATYQLLLVAATIASGYCDCCDCYVETLLGEAASERSVPSEANTCC